MVYRQCTFADISPPEEKRRPLGVSNPKRLFVMQLQTQMGIQEERSTYLPFSNESDLFEHLVGNPPSEKTGRCTPGITTAVSNKHSLRWKDEEGWTSGETAMLVHAEHSMRGKSQQMRFTARKHSSDGQQGLH